MSLLVGEDTAGLLFKLIFAFLAVCCALTIYAIRISSQEKPVTYQIAEISETLRSDTACEKYETLDSPSLQVPKSTAIQCYAPATGKSLARVNPATAEGIDRAVARAKGAQKEWAKATFVQRRKVLKTLLKHILDNQDTIIRAACLDSGKTRVDACFGEVLATCEKLAWTVKHGEEVLRPERRGGTLLMMQKINELRYEPLGVIAALVSWNYPFHNFLNPVIATLMTGNAIVLKCSESTAFSTEYFLSIVRAALTVNGHSEHIIQCVVCWPSVAEHLSSHPSISHITFIGSRPVAHSVAASAARSLTPVTMELGGKDPAVVLDNLPKGDVARVCSTLMRGVFQAAGQNCIGIERIIASPHMYKMLLAELEPRVRALQVGSDLDSPSPIHVGALISGQRIPHLESLIAQAMAQGAILHCGGYRYQHPQFPAGHYFEPTMISNVSPNMAIAQLELFAPIMLLMPARDTKHVIELANSTSYALGCSVFGRHGSAEVERVTKEVHCGMVAANDFASYYLCNLPFGGAKGSGYGRFGGPEGLKSLCNLKSVCRDGFGGMMKTSIPRRLDYPKAQTNTRADERGANDATVDRDSKEKELAYDFVKSIVEIGYGTSLSQRVAGLVGLSKTY